LNIKSWTIIWLSDDDIARPVVAKIPKGKKKNTVEDRADTGNNNADNADVEDGVNIGVLQALMVSIQEDFFTFTRSIEMALGSD
jgi:hypothetical protein